MTFLGRGRGKGIWIWSCQPNPAFASPGPAEGNSESQPRPGTRLPFPWAPPPSPGAAQGPSPRPGPCATGKICPSSSPPARFGCPAPAQVSLPAWPISHLVPSAGRSGCSPCCGFRRACESLAGPPAPTSASENATQHSPRRRNLVVATGKAGVGPQAGFDDRGPPRAPRRVAGRCSAVSAGGCGMVLGGLRGG